MPINLGTINQFFRSAYGPDEARALIAQQAEELRRHGADELRREGHLPDRPPAVRGVHRALHRQAVADLARGAARPTSSAGCRCATPTTTATSTTPTRACRPTATPAWLERMADHPRIEVRLETDFFDTSPAGQQGQRRRQRARSSTPGRSTATSTTPRAASAGARSTSSRRCCRRRRLPGHLGDELPRRGRALHAHPRVPALPPRAGLPDRQDRHHARVLPVRRGRGRAVLPGQHRRRPRRPAEVPRPRHGRSRACSSAAGSAPTSTSTCTWPSASALSMVDNRLAGHFDNGRGHRKRRSRRMSTTISAHKADAEAARGLPRRPAPDPASVDGDLDVPVGLHRPQEGRCREQRPPRRRAEPAQRPGPGRPPYVVRLLLQRVPRQLLAAVDGGGLRPSLRRHQRVVHRARLPLERQGRPAARRGAPRLR